jgi:hypothetical protein
MKKILRVIFHPTKNNKIKKSLLLLTVAFFVGGFFVFNSVRADEPVEPKTITVCNNPCECDYVTIQAAINVASSGDTIEVSDGNYAENLQINKRLTIKSKNLHGATIQTQPGFNAGSGYGGITFLANGSTLEGFKIEQGVPQAVIHTHNSNNVTVKNNWIVGLAAPAPRGVDVGYSSANSDGIVIEGNIFDDLYCAVYINQATDLSIDSNDFRTMGDGAVVFDGTWNYDEIDIDGNTTTIGTKYLMYFYGAQGNVTHSNNILISPTLLSNWKVNNVTQGKFYTTIQGAINDANSGDIIDVAVGTYKETLAITKPITLKGAGSNQTIIDGEGLEMKDTSVIAIYPSNVTLEGIKVINGEWGIGVRNTSDIGNINFKDVVVEENNASGFVFDKGGKVSDVTFTDCRADKNGNRGIYFTGKTSENVTLINTSANNNQIMGFNNQGIMKNLVISGGTFNNNIGGYEVSAGQNLYGFGISVERTTGVDIQGVTASGNGTSGPAEGGAGIVIKGNSSNVEISGVTLTGNKIGLWIESGRSNPEDTTIKNSHISGNIDYGVKNDVVVASTSIETQGTNEIIQLVVDAKLNWWGDAEGPEQVILDDVSTDVATQQAEETREKVSENVLFDPWYVDENKTRDSNYVEPPTMPGGGPINTTPPTTGGGETEGGDETEGEVLGEMDSRDYKEQEEEKEGELDKLKNDKERLGGIKDVINTLLENIDDEEKENLLREVLERLSEMEESLDEEIEVLEEALEEVIEKRALSEQKEKAEQAEEAINKLLDEGDLTEEQRNTLEDILGRLEELKSGIEERLNQ